MELANGSSIYASIRGGATKERERERERERESSGGVGESTFYVIGVTQEYSTEVICPKREPMSRDLDLDASKGALSRKVKYPFKVNHQGDSVFSITLILHDRTCGKGSGPSPSLTM
jgi:hypothetical protein